MSDLAKKTAVVYGTLIALSALLYIFYLIHSILLDVAIALLIVIALEHFIRILQRFLSRTWACVAAYALVTVVIITALGIIIVPLTSQSVDLVKNVSQILSDLEKNHFIRNIDSNFHIVSSAKTYMDNLPSHIDDMTGPIFGILTNIATGFTRFVIIITFALFASIEAPDIWNKSISFFKLSSRKHIYTTARNIALAVSGFISGNLTLSLIAASVTVIILFIFRMPYILPLAVMMGVFDLIPLVGAASATIIIGFIAIEKGYVTVILVMSLLFTYQFIESHVLSPIIYSKSVLLSPLLVLIACFAGAEIYGILGALIAIPFASAIQILLQDIYKSGLITSA